MPRGWVSLALLVWGGYTEAWPGAVVMALMLEAVALSPVKWAMGKREFHRAADLTSVIFAVITVVQFSRYSVHGIYEILAVAPYCFFPLLLAERASTTRTIPMSALFYSLRRYPEQDRELDIAPHYIVICILAASTGAERGVSFIALVALLVIGIIGAARPRRYSWPQWSVAIVLALAVAAATQLGVQHAQRALENSFIYWFNQFPWSGGDPNRAITAIGAIGRLKLSDQIRVRVSRESAAQIPLMLQEASYDVFKFGSWSATGAKFEALDKISGRDAWATDDSANPATSPPIEITVQHRRELTLLPVPRGTARIDSGELAELQRNRFGTLLGEAPPGALRFIARRGEPPVEEPPPTSSDLEIPAAYASVIAQTAAEIGHRQEAAASRADHIRDFFLNNFTYSLIQRGGFSRRTPLAHFLTETRRGHCEYFATAAALLLREAGIPARYAVGYVVEEYSELERAYIGRARHAHAWALAHINGRWVTIDATPSVWFAMESAYASRWQGLQDFGAWIWYGYQRLAQADFSELSGTLIWLVPPLAIVLYLRLRKSPIAVRDEAAPATPTAPGDDCAVAELIAELRARGLSPSDGETTARFLRRAAPASNADIDIHDIIREYYWQRFAAPRPDPDAEQRLRDWVRRYRDGLLS